MKVTIKALKSNRTKVIVEDWHMDIMGYRHNATFRYAQNSQMTGGFISIAGNITENDKNKQKPESSMRYIIKHDKHTSGQIKNGLTMMFRDIANTIREKNKEC